MKLIPKIPLTLIFLLSLAYPVSAQRDQMIAGTRPISMGEAFVAVADDGNAVHWNPAGLARMERIQAGFAFSDLFGIGIKNYYVNFLSRFYFIPPLTDYLSFGFDWLGIQNEDEELDYHQNQIDLAVAFRPPKYVPMIRNLSLGFNVKYIEMGTLYGDVTELDADGWGWDIGILYHLNELPHIPGSANLGIMVQDLAGTMVTHDAGVRETILPQSIRWGISYRPLEDLSNNKIPLSDPTFAIDIDDRFHFGLEFWLWRALAVRCGLQKDLHTSEKITLSFGLGFKTNLKEWPEANIDYALTNSPVLPNTNKQFGGSIILKENPRLIRIEGAHINNVFASLYLHYATPGASIGSIKLRNISNDTLKARVSLEKNRYLEAQQADTLLLAPESCIDFPLRAIFKPDVFYAPEGRLTGEVKVAYQFKKNQYISRAAIDFKLFCKNYLTWDDPGKAAAFVTYDDRMVQNFVDKAINIKSDTGKAQWFLKYNMSDAVVLFSSLKAYGLKYRVDPVTPFPGLADMLHGALYRPDKVQYPAELLSREERFGDCDDFSVLYASLLQNAGLASAFVSIPGHIFIMVDTGIHESRILSLPFPPSLFFTLNGSLWLPIETTSISTTSFVDAWHTAAMVLQSFQLKSNLEICEVADNQKKYPPVSPGLIKISKEISLNAIDFTAPFQQELEALDELKNQYLQTLEDKLKPQLTKLEQMESRNTYGVVLGNIGDYKNAKSSFLSVLALDSTFVPAWNNLGNIEFIRGNFQTAESLYIKALNYNPFSRGLYLNLAILYQTLAHALPEDSLYYQKKSDAAMTKVVQLSEGQVQKEFSILGFEKITLGGKASRFTEKVQRKIENVISFLSLTFKQYQQKREIKGATLDLYELKGIGKIDEDRGEILFWSY